MAHMLFRQSIRRPMPLVLLRSPTAREADLQRQLDLALVQLRIVLRLTGGQRLAFTETAQVNDPLAQSHGNFRHGIGPVI